MGVLDKSAKAIFLAELISGMALTLKYFFKPKVTLNYPYEKGPLSPRFRESTRCVAIPVEKNGALPANSVRLCPAQAITIEAEPRDDGSATTRYDIDMVKCICAASAGGLSSRCHCRRAEFWCGGNAGGIALR